MVDSIEQFEEICNSPSVKFSNDTIVLLFTHGDNFKNRIENKKDLSKFFYKDYSFNDECTFEKGYEFIKGIYLDHIPKKLAQRMPVYLLMNATDPKESINVFEQILKDNFISEL
jgi:hypothetical protein